MIKKDKISAVDSLVESLKENGNFILTDYSGVKVNELAELRSQLREKNAQYRVVKNNLFKRALEQAGYSSIDEYLKGPVGVAFGGEQIGEVARVLKDFSKEKEKFSFSIGVLDSTVYQESDIKKIANLPSMEVLLAQTMSLVNGPASGIAMGMNEVMASLARGIKAVAETNNNQ